MKTGIYLELTLREDTGKYVGLSFLLPISLLWWEGVSNDLHLQFAGHERHNIRPADNAHNGEMVIPKKAKVFRVWLKSMNAPHKGRIHICSNMLFLLRPTKSHIIPPKEAMDDLILHWDSPNDPQPRR